MTMLSVGRAPVSKSADQLRAERRDRAAARHRLVGTALDYATNMVFALGFLLVLVAG